jgi:LuxR family transcriptional regulator of csgAB operon
MNIQVYILGPRKLQNSLIARYLEQNGGISCFCFMGPEEIPATSGNPSHPDGCILWDCRDRDLSQCLPELEAANRRPFQSFYTLLFNLRPGSALQEPALKIGIRGFLYAEDPIELFPRAIEAVCNEELWVSREVLTQSFLRGGNDGHRPPPLMKTNILTPRETEILVLVSSGSKNEQIAEELHISPNTVKTHIYNIFKKIDVPNRLQAALWAVKNL